MRVVAAAAPSDTRSLLVLSSLELHNFLGALLVKYAIAAVSTSDHIVWSQGVGGTTVAANVRNALRSLPILGGVHRCRSGDTKAVFACAHRLAAKGSVFGCVEVCMPLSQQRQRKSAQLL